MSINPKKKAVKIGAIVIGAIIGLTTIASLIIPNSLSQNPLLANSLSEYYSINQNDVNIIKQLIANDDSISNDKKQELNENINNILTGNINNKTAPLSIYNKKELSNNLHFEYKINYDSQISTTINILPIFDTTTVKKLIKSVYEETETYLNNINSFRIDLITDLEAINSPEDKNITNLINILKQDINNLYIRELRLQVLRNDIWKDNFEYNENLKDQLKTDKNNNFKEIFKTFTFSIPFLKIDKIKLVNETIPNDLIIGSDGKYHTNEFLNIDTNLILTYDEPNHSFVYKKNGNAVFYVSLTEDSLKTLQGTFRYDIKNYLKTPSDNPKLNISIPDTNDKSKWIRVNDGHNNEDDNVYKPNKTADNITISKNYDSVVYKNQLNSITNITKQKKPLWVAFLLFKNYTGNNEKKKHWIDYLEFNNVVNNDNIADGVYLLPYKEFEKLTNGKTDNPFRYIDITDENDYFKEGFFINWLNSDKSNKRNNNNEKIIDESKVFKLNKTGWEKVKAFHNTSLYERTNYIERDKFIDNGHGGNWYLKNGKWFLNPNNWQNNWDRLEKKKYTSIKNNGETINNYYVFMNNIVYVNEDTLKELDNTSFDKVFSAYDNFRAVINKETDNIVNIDGKPSNLNDFFNNENLFKKFISNNWIINEISHDKEQYGDDDISNYIKTRLFKDSGNFYDVNNYDKELQNFQKLPFIENKATYKKYYQINDNHPFNQFLNNNGTLIRILGEIIDNNRYEVDEKTISLYKTYIKIENELKTKPNDTNLQKQQELILKELKEYLINLINKKLSIFNPLGNIVIKNGVYQYIHQVLINQKLLPDDFLAIKDSLNINRENIKLKLKNITYENWNMVPDNIKNWLKFLGITIRNVLITNIATIGANRNINQVDYDTTWNSNMFDYYTSQRDIHGNIIKHNLVSSYNYRHPNDMINRINNVSEYPFRLVFDFQLNINTDFYKYIDNSTNWSTRNFIKGQNVKNRNFINNLLKNSIDNLEDLDSALYDDPLNDNALWDVYTENNNDFNNNKIHFMAPYRRYGDTRYKILSYLPLWTLNDRKTELYFYNDYYNYDYNGGGAWLENRYNAYLDRAESYRELFKLDSTDFINNNILKSDNSLNKIFKKIINNSNLFNQMLRNLKYRYGTTTDQYDYFEKTLTYIANFIKKNPSYNIDLTDLLGQNSYSLKVLNDLSINDILPEKRELFDKLDDKLNDKKSSNSYTYNDTTTAKWLTSSKKQDNVIRLSKDSNSENYKLKSNRNGDILYPYFNYAKNWKYETPYDEIINNLDIEKMKKTENTTFSTVPTGLINNYLGFVNSLRYKVYDNNDTINIKNIKDNELYYDEITRQQIKTWLENFLNNNKNVYNKDTLITNLINEIKTSKRTQPKLPYSFKGYTTEFYDDYNELRDETVTEPVYIEKEVDSDEWEYYQVKKYITKSIRASERPIFYSKWGSFQREHANFRENYEIEQVKNFIRSQPELYNSVIQNGYEDFDLLDGFSNFKGRSDNDWEYQSSNSVITNTGRNQYILRKYEFGYYVTERRKKKKIILVQNGTRTYTRKVPTRKTRSVYKETSGKENNRINVLTLLWYFENHYFFDDFKINDKLNIDKIITNSNNDEIYKQYINELYIRKTYNIKETLFQSQYNPYIFFKTTSGIKIVKRIPLIDNINANADYNLYTSTEAEGAIIDEWLRKNKEIKVNIYTNQNDNVFKDDTDLQNLLREEIAKKINLKKSTKDNLDIINEIIKDSKYTTKIVKPNNTNNINDKDKIKEVENNINIWNYTDIIKPRYSENTELYDETNITSIFKNAGNGYVFDDEYVYINNNTDNKIYRTPYRYIDREKTDGKRNQLLYQFVNKNTTISFENKSYNANEILKNYFKNHGDELDIVDFDTYIQTLLNADFQIFETILNEPFINNVIDNNKYSIPENDNNYLRNNDNSKLYKLNMFNIIRYQSDNYALDKNKPEYWDKLKETKKLNMAYRNLIVIPAIKYVNYIKEKLNKTFNNKRDEKLFIINTMIELIRIYFTEQQFGDSLYKKVINLPKRWNNFFNGYIIESKNGSLNNYLRYIKQWDADFKEDITTDNLSSSHIKKILKDHYYNNINKNLDNYKFNINSKEMKFNIELLDIMKSAKNQNVKLINDYGFIYEKDDNTYINEIIINGKKYGYYTDYKTMWNAWNDKDNQAGEDDIVLLIDDRITNGALLQLQSDINISYLKEHYNNDSEAFVNTLFYDQLFGNLLPHQKTLLKIPLDKLINYQRMVQFVYKSDKYGDLLISIDIDNDWSIYIGDTNYHTAANVALDDIKALENWFAFKNTKNKDLKDLKDYSININVNQQPGTDGLNNRLTASIDLSDNKIFNNLHTNKWFDKTENDDGSFFNEEKRTEIKTIKQTLDYYEKIWKTKSDAKPIRFENIAPITKQDIDNFFKINYHSDNALKNDYNLGSFINNVGLYNLINNKMFDMLNLIFDIDKVKQYQRLAFKDFDSDFDFDRTNQILDEYINLLQPLNDMVAILTKRNLMMFKTIIPAFKEMINQQGNFKDFNELLTLNSKYAISDVIKKVITDITYTMNSINQIETMFNERYNLSKYKELNLISNYDNILFEYNAVNHFNNTNGKLNNNFKDTVYYNFKFTPLKELSNYIDYQNHTLIIGDISTLSEAKQHHIRQLVSFFNQQMLNNNKILKMFNDETYRSRIINIMNMFFNTLYYEITNRLLHTFILNDDKLAVLNNLNEALKKVKNYEYQYYENRKPSGYGSFIITRNSTWNQLQPYMTERDDQELDDKHQNKGNINDQDYYIKNNTGSRIYPNPNSPYYKDKDTNTITPITTNNFDISNRENKLKETVESDFEYDGVNIVIKENTDINEALKTMKEHLKYIFEIQDIHWLMYNIFSNTKTINIDNNSLYYGDFIGRSLKIYYQAKSRRNEQITVKQLNNINNNLEFIVNKIKLYFENKTKIENTNETNDNITKKIVYYRSNQHITFSEYGNNWIALQNFIQGILNNIINTDRFISNDTIEAFLLGYDLFINQINFKANIISPKIYKLYNPVSEFSNSLIDDISKINNSFDNINFNLLYNYQNYTGNGGYDIMNFFINARNQNESLLNNINLQTKFIEQLLKIKNNINNSNFVDNILELENRQTQLNKIKAEYNERNSFNYKIKAFFKQNFLDWFTHYKELDSNQKQEIVKAYNKIIEENRLLWNKWWIENNNSNDYVLKEVIIIDNNNLENKYYITERKQTNNNTNNTNEPSDTLSNNPDEPYDYLPDDEPPMMGEVQPV